MNRFPHLNDTYISEKLKQQLFEMSTYPVTVITAPTGYGKTTAMKWWDDYRKRYLPDSAFYRMNIVGDNPVEFWEDFCRMVRKKSPELADKIEQIGYPETARSVLMVVDLWEEVIENNDQETYFVYDDVHLLAAKQIAPLFCFLIEHLPEKAHIILISRNTVFNKAQRIKLGRKLLDIPREAFQLNEEEIMAYSQKCGLPLSKEDARRLEKFSDGWISLIYLIFCIYVKQQKWQFDQADINRLIQEVMIDPLTTRQRAFLSICTAMEEFTEEEVSFLWEEEDAADLLEKVSSENAFITRTADGVYHCHKLLCENTKKIFEDMPLEEQRKVWKKLGDWFLSQGSYLQAMAGYRKGDAWEELIDTVILDKGSSLGGSHEAVVHEWTKKCPPEILRNRPDAIVVIAMYYFSSGDIPGMLRLMDILQDVIDRNDKLLPEEKDNYKGEMLILKGFLEFNNIPNMSRYHKQAAEVMHRTSNLVSNKSPWSFGSPSITALYHSECGKLDQENRDMAKCVPYYETITDHHGSGGEYAMLAETEFLRGNFQEAEIAYYQAIQRATQYKQYSIAVDAEFTAARMNLFCSDYQKGIERLARIREQIVENDVYVLIPTVEGMFSWLGGALGRKELIAEWLFEDSATDSIITLTVPILYVVQNEAFLATGQYTRILAKREEILEACWKNRMILALIYVYIQFACAYLKLDRKAEARDNLKEALLLALPDGIAVPFAEHSAWLKEEIDSFRKPDFYPEAFRKIDETSEKFQAARQSILEDTFRVTPDFGFSEREKEIADLAAERRTIKEIAQTLHLSENTVKFHLKQIYGKLGIISNSRNKRQILEKILKNK